MGIIRCVYVMELHYMYSMCVVKGNKGIVNVITIHKQLQSD